VLGLETSGPVLLTLRSSDDADAIWTLAAGRRSQARPVAGPAGSAARAAIQLAKFAQRMPALLVADESAVAGNAHRENMVTVPAAAVAHFRRSIIESVAVAGEARVPLEEGGTATFRVFRDAGGGSPVAIIVGEPDFSAPVPVRLHSACLTGDVFGSRRCDCGAQLRLALARLTEAGGGVIIYLEQEGRGLGLANKMRAYALQDHGLDTVDANTTLGFDDDERDYGVAARMLQLMGCTRVLLLTNNPSKLDALVEAGVEVSGRLPLYTPVNADNRRYLFAKAARAGHWLDAGPLQAADTEDEQVGTMPGP
jgi:GTP cyclohydrolase II